MFYIELYNGKQLLELSQQEIRRITEQAKVYHDKIYDPEEAASRLTAALAAVKSGNQAELYNIASGKFTDAPVSENSSDFSVLVETCPDEFDEEYANGECLFLLFLVYACSCLDRPNASCPSWCSRKQKLTSLFSL